jgi:hypothetical protein
VIFSYLAFVQDKKNHVRFTGKCMLYSLCQRTIEILPEGVGDFTVLHFCRWGSNPVQWRGVLDTTLCDKIRQ